MTDPTQMADVTVAHDGPIRVLTLSNPARRNALSPELKERLREALETVMEDDACKVVVLTGAGGHFSAGGDLSTHSNPHAVEGRRRIQRLHPITRMLVRGDKPVIAAVEGHAAGAGLCLAAACDVVVASDAAKFSCTFNKVGLFPDLGGTWTLPQRMGLGRAKMLMLTGGSLNAAAAQAQGLVEVLTAAGEALNTALRVAREISLTAPISNSITKAILGSGPASLDQVLAAEANAQGVLFGSEDFKEGFTAFLEKRAPSFKGN
jgi:enoyl-CoA hydratase/carnithine racemase